MLVSYASFSPILTPSFIHAALCEVQSSATREIFVTHRMLVHTHSHYEIKSGSHTFCIPLRSLFLTIWVLVFVALTFGDFYPSRCSFQANLETRQQNIFKSPLTLECMLSSPRPSRVLLIVSSGVFFCQVAQSAIIVLPCRPRPVSCCLLSFVVI